MASPVNRQVTWAGREGQKRKELPGIPKLGKPCDAKIGSYKKKGN